MKSKEILKGNRLSRSAFFLFLFGCIIIGCKEKKEPAPAGQPATTRIEIRQPHFNFGNLSEGEIATHCFRYKNTGQANFVIKAVESGCGCTTVKYDEEPLPPGKEGKIEIAFNSSGRYGKQYKEIRIFANLPEGETVLTITANVN